MAASPPLCPRPSPRPCLSPPVPACCHPPPGAAPGCVPRRCPGGNRGVLCHHPSWEGAAADGAHSARAGSCTLALGGAGPGEEGGGREARQGPRGRAQMEASLPPRQGLRHHHPLELPPDDAVLEDGCLPGRGQHGGGQACPGRCGRSPGPAGLEGAGATWQGGGGPQAPPTPHPPNPTRAGRRRLCR